MIEARILSIDSAFSEAAVMRGLGEAAELPVVAGRYELVRRIGRGGQGVVFEARDLDLDRMVAVKALPLGNADEAKREGQMLAKLDHPNVVSVYDHGLADDCRYYVLQLLDGPTLREWCSGKSPEEIVGKYAEAARGLEAAHAAGLVHRDFKPSNVRIASNGSAVVVDFGLARNLQTLEADSEERCVVAGTLAYAAPERLHGSAGDERSDQFSFCVALWEALSGTNPFGLCGRDVTPESRCHAMRAGRQGSPRGGKRVVKALERGLARMPADRFNSISQLIDVLVCPTSRRVGGGELAAGIVSLSLAFALGGLLPDHQPSSPWLYRHLTAIDAEVAVAMAAAGDEERALQALRETQWAELSPEESDLVARAAQRVALELELQGKISDAGVAWMVAVMRARESGDRHLEQQIDQRWKGYLSQLAQQQSM